MKYPKAIIIGVIFIVYNIPYGIDNKFITIEKIQENNTASLSRIITLDKINTEKIEVRVKGKTKDMDIAYKYPSNYGKELLIHGLYPNYNNTVTIKGSGINITTNIQTVDIPNITNATIKKNILSENRDPYNQDLYFYHILIRKEDSSGAIVGVDKKGDIRYFQKTDQKHLHRIFYSETFKQILIMDDRGIIDLVGRPLIRYPKKVEVHHDSIPIKDNYLLLANSTWGTCDRIVEITASGKIVNDKTFGSLFRDIVTDPTELSILNKIIYDDRNIFKDSNNKNKAIDWAHANSLVYNRKKDVLYLSLRNQAVIAVDYSNWELLWLMADNTFDTIHPGVPNRGVNFLDIPSLDPYRVKGDALTNGPKNQHSFLLLKNGNLAMFDNQGDEKTNKKGSRYIEYKITYLLNNWRAKTIKEYRDPNLYSRITSDVDLTGNNHENILITYGEPRRILEIDYQTKKVLVDLQINASRWLYRADKMPLYPYSSRKKIYSIDYNQAEGR